MSGAPVFEYQPATFGPMTVALLFILAFVTPLAAADRLLAGSPGEAAASLVPLLLLLAFGYLSAPSATRVFDDGLEVPRARAARWAGARRRFDWADTENIYPSFYEDAGMRFSPFASAEGTAKHAGVRVEPRSGKPTTLEFTPAVLNLRKKGTPAYREAVEVLRAARRAANLPMVTTPPQLTQAQAEEMLTAAARPLLAFPVTVAGILAPAFLIPLLLVAATQALGPLGDTAALGLTLLGLLPLFAVFAYVNLKARRRARMLHEVQKWREHRRGAAQDAGEG